MADLERLVPKDYASIKAELAHIVPCYSEPTGCLLSDEENEQRCEDGCFILSVYKAGATAAITEVEDLTDTIEQLTIALHDAINAPKGVVPTSAEPFYQPRKYYHD